MKKQKLANITAGADVSPITSIKRNGTIVAPVNKVVDINVPTKMSDLSNDSNYQTLSQVQALVAQAPGMQTQIVTELPTTGDQKIIYLKLESSGGVAGDVYGEFIWVTDKFEKIGTTATTVDLSGYVQSSELVAITSGEIDTLTASA